MKKGGLSFGDEEEEANESSASVKPKERAGEEEVQDSSAAPTDSEDVIPKKRLKPNTSVSFQPKAQTKSSLLREAALKDQLRKEYAQVQEAVKETEFCLPFVFFAGKNTPGGVCRMKKGDAVWLFLETARKVGADMAAKGDGSKRDWARISVDDLIVVKGDLIVPHVSAKTLLPKCLLTCTTEKFIANVRSHAALHLPPLHPQQDNRLQKYAPLPALLGAHTNDTIPPPPTVYLVKPLDSTTSRSRAVLQPQNPRGPHLPA